MLLMIDNYDSFTYNLVQYLGELGANVQVFRNDQLTLADIQKLAPTRIVISPGPCTPNEALERLQALSAWPLFEIDYSAIVRAAARSGAARLYTEDLSHGQEILGVAIVNPFHGIGELA